METTPTSSLAKARQEAQTLIDSLEIQKARADHEVTSVIDRALKRLEDAQADEEEKAPWVYEVRLWMKSPSIALSRGRQEQKSLPLSERFGDWAKNNGMFPLEADAHFQIRFDNSQNPFLKARYADFLATRAELQNNKNAARDWVLKAVPLYLQSVPLLAVSPEIKHQIEASQVLDAAAHLALSRAPKELLPDVVVVLRQFLSTASRGVATSEAGEPLRYGRWALEAGDILLAIAQKAKNQVSNDDLEWWQTTAQQLAQKNAGLGEPLLEQNFWAQTAQAAFLRGNKSEQFVALNERAESKIREAHARAQGPGASGLAAAAIMENAVEYLDRLRGYALTDAQRQAIAEKQTQLKRDIRRFYEEGKEEIGVHVVPLDTSPEQIEAATAPFLEPSSLKECLQKLGDSFLPDLANAKQWADSQAGDDSIMSLVGTSLLGDGLGVRAYNTEAEKHEFEVNRAYEVQFHFNNKLLLPIVWEKLRTQKGLNAASLFGYLDERKLLGQRNRPLVQAGIAFYFADDFAAALHLLVPQLEDVIRNLFERAGVPPIKQSKGGNGWEFESFGLFLRRIDKEKPGLLTPKLRVYVERILSDPTGWNLRNTIAHGLISWGECNRVVTETVLHFYLCFALFEEAPTITGELKENFDVTTPAQ